MSGSTPEADNDELREWKKTGEEKFCPMRYDPTAFPLPLLRCAIDPLAWVGKRIWANPVTASGKRSPQSSIETMADRKSTRLNSSHITISYAVFCLKKKNKTQ